MLICIRVLMFCMLCFYSSLALSQSKAKVAATKVDNKDFVATLAGEVVNLETLPASLKEELHKINMQVFQEKTKVFESYLLSQYITKEAAAKKVLERSYRAELFAIDDLTEKELRQWFEEHKSSSATKFEDVKDLVVKEMRKEKSQAKKLEVLQKVKKEEKFAVLTREPKPDKVDLYLTDFQVTFSGKTLTHKNFPIAIKARLFEIKKGSYKARNHVLQKYLLHQYLQKHGQHERESQADKDAFLKSLLAVDTPTQKELKQWFEENNEDSAVKYEDVKDTVYKMVVKEKEDTKKLELAASLVQEMNFQVLTPEPVSEKVSINLFDAPRKGDAKADVTIVKFSDFFCGYCAKASVWIKEVLKEYEGDDTPKVSLVYMPYSLFGEISIKLNSQSYCAHKQDKFWQFHDMVFDMDRDDVRAKSFQNQMISTLKLDGKAFESCMAAKSTRKFVDQIFQEGNRIGVRGTPYIFIEGMRFEGYNAEGLRKDIEKMLVSK